MDFHPIAEAFPLLEGKAFDELVEDIRANGLQEPIVTYEDKILDGRNRFRACQHAGVKPAYKKYEGNAPINFVVSHNIHRRHLNASQRAMALAKLQTRGAGGDRRSETARSKMSNDTFENVPTVTELAKAGNVGFKTLVKGRSVQTDAIPAVRQAVERGELSVNAAAKIAKLPKAEQKAALKPPRNQPREKRIADIKRMAGEGYLAAQIGAKIGVSEQQVRKLARETDIKLPDAIVGRQRKIDPIRIVEQTVYSLEGNANSLSLLNGNLDIEPDQAATWAAVMGKALTPINRLRKQLLEIANG